MVSQKIKPFFDPTDHGSYLVVARGWDGFYHSEASTDTIPKIFEINPVTGLYTERKTFGGWFANGLKPQGMTTSSSTGNVYFNVGNINGSQDFAFYPAIPFPTSRLEQMDLATYANYVLLTGDEEIGRYFVGDPSPGGGLNEPINDRYILQTARWGGAYAHKAGTLIIYDRLDLTHRVISLGPETSAYPVGKPYQLPDGKVIGSLKTESLVVDNILYLGERASNGHYIWDPSDNTVSATSYTGLTVTTGNGPRNTRPTQPLEYVLLDNGSLWAMSIGTNSIVTLAVAYDPDTGDPLYDKTFGVEASNSNAWLTSDTIHTLAAKGDLLFFLAQSYYDDGYELWCADSTDTSIRGTNATSIFREGNASVDYAHEPVRGGTYSTATDEMFIMTAKRAGLPEGRIHLVNMDNCASGVGLTAVVTGMTDIPSTKMIEVDGQLMYFGTENGKLMRFNPVDYTVTEIADMTPGSGTAKVRGYLDEVDGVIRGIVHRYDTDGRASARMLFAYDIESNTVTQTDVSDQFREDELYPGVILLE